jgi:hypothetical protein
VENPDEARLFAQLASELKSAHARVRDLDASDEVRVALARRLLVITESSKHDLLDASRRLASLMAALDEGWTPTLGPTRHRESVRHQGDWPIG